MSSLNRMAAIPRDCLSRGKIYLSCRSFSKCQFSLHICNLDDSNYRNAAAQTPPISLSETSTNLMLGI